jgi:cytochrome c oxidase subunit 1
MTTLTAPDIKTLPQPTLKGKNYLNHSRGLLSWIFTLDHKRIGVMYMIAVLTFFAVGGLFAVLLRTELIAPGPTLVSNEDNAWNFYNQMFTLHGAVMVFLFIIPAIPAILGNFVLPIMLGAKDVAFPRLNLLSFHVYFFGALFFLWVLAKGIIVRMFPSLYPYIGGGGLETGWTFYTPYSTTTESSAVVEAVLGAFILGFSSILTGVNFIASIHMLRPNGMRWFRMPLMLWALYGTSIIQILATPVLAITLMLLAAERILHIGIFDPNMGGDPVLFQHFFWFYSHPAVYIMILPAMGIISELMSTFSRKHIFGYKFIAYSSIAIAILGFLVWGHHMFTSGQSPLANAVFSLLTFSVSIPSAIKVFNWLSTMYKGSISLKTPMLYALGFMMLFSIGGLTGLFLGALGTDIHFHDTYFIVAHFHYVMMGSTLFAFLGGMYYWWPKMFGKMYSEFVGAVAAVLVFIGFNLTFFPQFVAGSQGMPRRYADYIGEFGSVSEGFWIYHFLSTLGAYLMAVGLVLVLCNWIHSLLRGKKAAANPWGSNTLEWHCASPPPHENFAVAPTVGDPYDFHLWVYDETIDGYVKIDESKSAAQPTPSPAHAH